MPASCFCLGKEWHMSAKLSVPGQPPSTSGTRPLAAIGMPPIQTMHLHQVKTKGSPPLAPVLALLPPPPLSPKRPGSPGLVQPSLPAAWLLLFGM